MSIQGELKRCMKERYPDLYSDLYFDIRLHGSKKNEGLIQDEETEKVLYVNAKTDGDIFYGEAIPDEYFDCYDIDTETGHTAHGISELCDGLASEFLETREQEKEIER